MSCFLVSACDQSSNSDKLAALENEVADLKAKRNVDDLDKDSDKEAYLTPGAEGYSTVRFDLGVLTVRLVNVTAYANGSNVTLEFGNTLSSTIQGLKATIEWGKVDDKGHADNTSAKSRDVTFNQPLQGGAWTSIPVVLEGIPPAELGFVRVRNVHHSGIQLR